MVRWILFSGGRSGIWEGLGLLLLRLVFAGSMLLSHGWGKLLTFQEKVGMFPDPLGVGSRLSLTLTVMAEFGCAALVVLGLATRVALVPLVITMGVAFFLIHGTDPWAKKELAALYGAGFLSLWFLGAGRYSIDSKLY